jgi:polyisoprenoid-binding protein YceI
MKSKSIAPLLLTFALATPALAADSYSIDSRHTFPVFEVNHLGFSTQRGRFNKTTGKISLDPVAKTGSVEVSIATDSIDMGLDEWDKHMKNPDFFDVEKHPAMTFKSDRFSFQDSKPVAAEGQLTLLGVTKPVKLAIANFRCGMHPIAKKQTCGADVSTTIKRSEWGMTKYVPLVSDEIRIHIPVEAFKD